MEKSRKLNRQFDLASEKSSKSISKVSRMSIKQIRAHLR